MSTFLESFTQQIDATTQRVSIPSYGGIVGSSAETSLTKLALSLRKTMFSQSVAGSTKGFERVHDYISNNLPDCCLIDSYFATKNLMCVMDSQVEIDKAPKVVKNTYIFNHGMATLSQEGEVLNLSISCLDEDMLHTAMRGILPLISDVEKSSTISVITQSQRGPEITSIGKGGAKLVRENYTPDTLDGFDHVVEDLASPNPCGRLIILRGPPGCGKTYWLEGVIHSLPTHKFVILPPSILGEMVGPHLLNALINTLSDEDDIPEFFGPHRSTQSNKPPTVLVIEDADQILVSRGADTLPIISTILNLADGILGRKLDIRILATSNAPEDAIDPAIQREGRLCKMLELNPLTWEHANAIYQREVHAVLGAAAEQVVLGGKKTKTKSIGFGSASSSEVVTKKSYTLAEVYRAAKEYIHANRPAKPKEKDQPKAG